MGRERAIKESDRVDKDILRQYTDLQQEISDLQNRIDKKTALLQKMEEKGYVVKDAVKGTRSDGTIGSIVVEGFPYPDYSYQKSKLHTSKLRMQLKLEKLLEMTNDVEKFIDGIPDSRTRRIFRHRYLDNMTWVQVAHCIGKNATPDSCRVTHDRFLEEK